MPYITITEERVQTFFDRMRAAAPSAQLSYNPNTGIVYVPDDALDIANTIKSGSFLPTKEELKAYTSATRYTKEVGGKNIDGVLYPSDRDTQAKLTAAALFAQVDSTQKFKWKLADGTFSAELNATEMIALAASIGGYVNACFAKEADIIAKIDSGEITSRPEINAEFAAIT